MPEQQLRFQQNQLTIDTVLTLKQIIQKNIIHQVTYLTFIKYEKAGNRVDKEKPFALLQARKRRQGLVFQALYKDISVGKFTKSVLD
jgi:hypothetical protein